MRTLGAVGASKNGGIMGILRVMALFLLVHSIRQQVTNTSEEPFFWLKHFEKTCADDPTTDHQCGCDPECAKYGDCCPDSIYFKDEEQKLGASTATCHTEFNTQFFVMTRCPSTWEDPQTRYLCENPDPNYPKPVLDTLVTSLRTNITYRNSYCASCHNEFDQDLSLWPLQVFCEFDEFRVKGLDSLEYFQHMVYDEALSQWYFDLSGLEIDRQCVSCAISIFQENERYTHTVNCPSPPAVYFPKGTKVLCKIVALLNWRMKQERRLRECEFSIGYCAPDWNDTIEREKCEAYMAQIHACPHPYRNYHCALCNYAFISLEDCRPRSDARRWNHAFSELLHWRYEVTCDKSEVFDTLSRQCIKVLPYQMGARMEDGSCTNRSFYKEQYVLSEDNGSVFVPTLQATYYQHEFFIQDNLLVLCLPKHLVRQFAPELRHITTVGLSLSIICLVLHLLVLCLVPALVNLPAMNLASLCVALLILYSSFIAHGTENPGTTSCVVVGVIMHYGMLASFFWMLIISFDIFNMTRRTQTKLEAVKGLHLRRFIMYSTAGWVTPAIIAGSAVLLDYVIPTSSFAPGYNLHRCWFSQPNAILLFCLTPLAFIMSLNVVFFFWTSCLIRKMRRSTTTTATTHKDFKLHFRLFVIMGLTWITGVIAAAANVEVFWHFFVVFNTMQGVFIFITFTCNSEVLNELKSLFLKIAGYKTRATSSTGSELKNNKHSE